MVWTDALVGKGRVLELDVRKAWGENVRRE